MTSSSLCRALAFGVLIALAPGAAAQVADTQPIKIEAPKPKTEKFKGEVLVVTRVAITVRDRENKNLVRTFNYDKKLAEKINKHFDENNTYQHGDRVEIKYVVGTDEAKKIKGKRGQNRQ
ncbi:MAG: hypothetical protein L0212_01625 [Acidobacteria bacterium]|nr:hypothetical protein [Acidobacteriota bacterium]